MQSMRARSRVAAGAATRELVGGWATPEVVAQSWGSVGLSLGVEGLECFSPSGHPE